jgi:DNA repair protein RadC
MSTPTRLRAARTYSVGKVRLSITREGADQYEAGRCENPEAAAKLFLASAPDDGREHFRVLFLSTRHIPLAVHEVSVGCLTQTVVHPREAFRVAIVSGAAALVISHNHPSGVRRRSPLCGLRCRLGCQIRSQAEGCSA